MSSWTPGETCRGWNGDEGCPHHGKPENDGRCDYHAIRPYTVFGWLLRGVVYPVRQATSEPQRMVKISGACDPLERSEWQPLFDTAREAIREAQGDRRRQ